MSNKQLENKPFMIFPTKMSNMPKQFEFLMEVEEIQNEIGTNNSKELASTYELKFSHRKEKEGKRSESTCLNYFSVCRRLGILTDDTENFTFTLTGKKAFMYFKAYKRNNLAETFDYFTKCVEEMLCGEYRAMVNGKVVYPFAIIHYFMKRMSNQIYDPELFFLLLINDLNQVEEVIELAKEIRTNNLSKTHIVRLIESKQNEIGLTDEQVSHIFNKILPIPKHFLYHLNLVDKEKSSPAVEISDDAKLNFTAKMVLI